MSLDVAYSYCINLTKEQKLKIDKRVRRNKLELKCAVFFPFLPIPMPKLPFVPVEGFSPQQIIQNAKERAKSAVEKKLRPLAEAADDCGEAYEKYRDFKETMDAIDSLEKTMKAIDSLEKSDETWETLNTEEKYESIRNSQTDVTAIAKNTGYKAQNIQKCKNHLFYDNHRLDRYESLGEEVEIKRFDPNEKQARAWKRLEKGTHTKEDLTWLKHEKAEQWYEQKHNAGYSESHEKAESKWSGDPWTNTDTEDKE